MTLNNRNKKYSSIQQNAIMILSSMSVIESTLYTWAKTDLIHGWKRAVISSFHVLYPQPLYVLLFLFFLRCQYFSLSRALNSIIVSINFFFFAILILFSLRMLLVLFSSLVLLILWKPNAPMLRIRGNLENSFVLTRDGQIFAR